MVEGYCMKCKKKVGIKNPAFSKTSRGVSMAKGRCPICNIVVCRIEAKE